jgi:sarcosine oxidase subunit alpha
MIKVTINKTEFLVPEGTTLAAAIIASGGTTFRKSATGQKRGPLCGMGVCFECRVTINSLGHQKSCTILVENGMEVVTDE